MTCFLLVVFGLGWVYCCFVVVAVVFGCGFIGCASAVFCCRGFVWGLIVGENRFLFFGGKACFWVLFYQ